MRYSQTTEVIATYSTLEQAQEELNKYEQSEMVQYRLVIDYKQPGFKE